MIDFIIAQTLNGLVYSMLLFLLALGLSLTFGMLRVINLAHGAFFLMGAYFGITAWSLTQSFWAACWRATLGAALVGALLERSWLQRFYVRNELDQVILTFGFALVFADLMKMFWGKDIRSIPVPSGFSGAVSIAGTYFPSLPTRVDRRRYLDVCRHVARNRANQNRCPDPCIGFRSRHGKRFGI